MYHACSRFLATLLRRVSRFFCRTFPAWLRAIPRPAARASAFPFSHNLLEAPEILLLLAKVQLFTWHHSLLSCFCRFEFPRPAPNPTHRSPLHLRPLQSVSLKRTLLLTRQIFPPSPFRVLAPRCEGRSKTPRTGGQP